jgi:hypothetical protein
MSVIKVNNITNRDGTLGPVIAGIATVSSTSHLVVPTGRTGTRYADGGENIVRDGLVLHLDAKHSYPSTVGIGTTTAGAAATPGSSVDGEPYTWYDMSGYENNGQLVNQVGFSTADGGSLLFGGYVGRGIFNTPTSSTSPQTYEVWVKGTASPVAASGFGYILHTNSNGDALGGVNGAYMSIGYAGSTLAVGEIYASFDNVAGGWSMMGTGVIGDSINIRQIVLTWDGTTQIAYVDGIQRVSQPLLKIPPNFFTTTSFGSYRDSDYRQIQGNIYSIKAYSKALTAAEVLQNYDALKSRFGL